MINDVIWTGLLKICNIVSKLNKHANYVYIYIYISISLKGFKHSYLPKKCRPLIIKDHKNYILSTSLHEIQTLPVAK